MLHFSVSTLLVGSYKDAWPAKKDFLTVVIKVHGV